MAETRILFVDDDGSNRLLVSRILARKRPDVSVTLAATGAEALEQADANDIDLALLDLTLPDMSGEDVLKTLREKHTMPVVIVSGHTDPDTSKRLIEQGAAAYVVKPFDAVELLELIDRLLS